MENNKTKTEQYCHLLDITMQCHQYRQDALIEILHDAQKAFGYLDQDTLTYIAKGLKLPLSRVYGVASFYHLFSLKPQGQHSCEICVGTACHVKGASSLLDILEQEIGLRPGDTTADGKVSLMKSHCIGTCGLALSVVYDKQILGQQTPELLLKRVKGWLQDKEQLTSDN